MTVQIITGDARDRLRELPDASVHCCVTSPPYFGLRDYGVEGQMGLESTPAEFVAGMVALFREVRRVLRDDGTLWLNLGDSYARAPAKGGSGPGKNANYADSFGAANRKFRAGSGRADGIVDDRNIRNRDGVGPVPGLKEKDLIGIPWRVAFALQSDGWFLRQDIIWSKPNPMPESVRDRCTKAHEYVFLLSKGPRYYFDAGAIAEPVAPATITRLAQDVDSQAGSDRVPGKTNGAMKAVSGSYGHGAGRNDGDNRPPGGWTDGATRNKRSVWTVATQPFKEAHFATFPPALIEPCILAGCPVGGTVLDPFGGAGTTGLVSDRLQRDAILIELNPAYAEMARQRIVKDAGLFGEVA